MINWAQMSRNGVKLNMKTLFNLKNGKYEKPSKIQTKFEN